MASGFGVTKEPGTDLFAGFNDAGCTVLAFDYRHLGESGGQPRQVARMGEQLADWQAAIGCAAGLPGVNPAKLALWGFSVSGGHVFRVAARNPHLAAAIAPDAERRRAGSATQCGPLPEAGRDGTVRRPRRSGRAGPPPGRPGPKCACRSRCPCGGPGAPHRAGSPAGGHYAPFLEAHEEAVAADLTFLRLHLLG